jgi:micrococcal nuclease
MPRSPRGWIPLAAALLAALVIVLSRLSTTPLSLSADVPHTVTTVFDGDTVQLDGQFKVRLIGIDAMDSYNQDKVRRQAEDLGMSETTVRRWSKKATDRAKELLKGERIRVEFGPEREDDYGRTLAYVYVRHHGEELLFDRLMIAEGLATATRKWPHPHREEFIKLEMGARTEKIGLWKDAHPRTPNPWEE